MLLCLLAAVTWSLGVLAQKPALRRLPGGDRFRIFGGMNGMFDALEQEYAERGSFVAHGPLVPDELVQDLEDALFPLSI